MLFHAGHAKGRERPDSETTIADFSAATFALAVSPGGNFSESPLDLIKSATIFFVKVQGKIFGGAGTCHFGLVSLRRAIRLFQSELIRLI